jgi:STE24 endopeptidase
VKVILALLIAACSLFAFNPAFAVTSINVDAETQFWLAKHLSGCAGNAPHCEPSRVVTLLSNSIFAAVIWLFFWFGFARRNAALAMRLTSRLWLQDILFVLFAIAWFWLIHILVRAYEIWPNLDNFGGAITIREETPGVFKLPVGSFEFLTHYLELLIVLFIGTALIAPPIMGLARKFNRHFWMIPAISWSIFSIWNLQIDGRYKRVEPLPDTPVFAEIAAMAKREGVNPKQLFIGFDPGYSNTRNATVRPGFGAQKIIFDSELIPQTMDTFERGRNNKRAADPLNPHPLTDREMRSIAGHELAHVRHYHAFWGALTSLLLVFFWFGMCWYLAGKWSASRNAAWKLDGHPEYGRMACFLALGLIAMGLDKSASIVMQNAMEAQADRTGLNIARDPDAAASLAIELNKGQPRYWSLVDRLTVATHPSTEERVRIAMEWKARHLAKVNGQK